MGIIFSRKIKRICSFYEQASARVLIVGLDSVGKSTLVARFKNLVDLQLDTKASYIEHIITEPTFVYQVETVYPRLAPIALNLWDLGGQEKTRELWRFYLTGVEGVVFVIDCNDEERLTLARQELLAISDKLGRSPKIPIIIAANKQDLPNSFKKEELILALSLPKIKSGEWKIFEMSAHTGNNNIQRSISIYSLHSLGGGVMEMFCFLSQSIHNRR